MDNKYLQVICNTCSEQDSQVDFEFLRQDDDFVVLKCPVC